MSNRSKNDHIYFGDCILYLAHVTKQQRNSRRYDGHLSATVYFYLQPSVEVDTPNPRIDKAVSVYLQQQSMIKRKALPYLCCHQTKTNKLVKINPVCWVLSLLSIY